MSSISLSCSYSISKLSITFRIAQLSAPFENGGNEAKPLKKVPKDDILLELYALNQLGKHGDVDTNRPGILDKSNKNPKLLLIINKNYYSQYILISIPIFFSNKRLKKKLNQAATNVKKLKRSPRMMIWLNYMHCLRKDKIVSI